MDSFYSINQVDINKQTLCNNANEVNSFYHVVCYDSEFKDDNGDTNDYTRGQSNYENVSNLIPNIPTNVTHDIAELPQEDMFRSPSKTFKAFTETVEALALQQSVIGNFQIKPASEEEVAKVVSATKTKFKKGVKFSDDVICIDDRGIEDVAEELSENYFVDANVLERSPENGVFDDYQIDDVVVLKKTRAKKLIRIPSETLQTERQLMSKIRWNIAPKEKPIVNHNRDSEHRRNILLKSFSSAPESTLERESFESFKASLSGPQNHSATADVGKIVNVKITENYRGSEGGEDFAGKYEASLMERACLEGRLDVLQVENKELLNVRVDLEQTIADLAMKIRNLEATIEHKHQNPDDETTIKNLVNQRSRLEEVILDARRLISEKDEEISALFEELSGNKELINKLDAQVMKGRTEVQSLDITIRDLKSKITEQYVDLQTTNQDKIISENEVNSLQGELRAALAAKEWYKEQLALCQSDKSLLQVEMTSTKGEMIRQATSIEKLKAENMRTKVNLNEIEQKLLSEKLSLARHLENIEAEMLEREALLMQSNKEYLTLKISSDIDDRPDTKGFEDPEVRLSILEEELSRCKLELERCKSLQEGTLEMLAECRKNCASQNDCISEKGRIVMSLEEERSALVEQVERLKLQVVEMDNKVDALVQEKAILQMDLTSTKEEKKVIDESMATLKQNLKVVEKNFHSMKVDLVNKTEELESANKFNEQRSQFDDDRSNLKEILNNNFNFLTSSPKTQETSSNECRSNSFTQTPVEELRTNDVPSLTSGKWKDEKEELEVKLLILVDQLKASQERHELRSNALHGIERELEDARNEAERLREKLKESEILRNLMKRDSINKSQLKENNSTLEDKPDRFHTIKKPTIEKELVQHSLQGEVIKVTTNHLMGLDVREAKLPDNVNKNLEDEIIGCNEASAIYDFYPVAKTGNVIKNVVPVKTATNFKSPPATPTNEILPIDPSECSGDCSLNLNLEKRLVDLQLKLLKAEQRTMVVEEQRNKVIFLEDQLDQVNQSRELESIKHGEEVEKMSGELSSLEGEVQRLQEELLLVRFDSTNSSYRESAHEFKNRLFESSKKKFYGARMFEHEELEPQQQQQQHQPQPQQLHQPQQQQHHQPQPQQLHQPQQQLHQQPEPMIPVDNLQQQKHQNSMENIQTSNVQKSGAMDQLILERDALEQQVQLLLLEKESLMKRSEDLLSTVDQLSKKNSILQSSLEEMECAGKEEVDKYKELVAGFELQMYELKVSIHQERNIMIHNFSLELEKERGKVLELLNSQALLKEHSSRLERILASNESSSIQMNSVSHDELRTKDSEIHDLKEKVKLIEGYLVSEQNHLKEAKKATLIERGNNVRLRLDAEELTVRNKQLCQEVTSLQEQLLVVSGKVESLERNNSRLTLEVEKLNSEVKVQMSEEEKLRRELGDLWVKDTTLNDQIKSLEWKLSQKNSELVASEERIVIMTDRHSWEVNSLTESLMMKTSEVKSLQAEMMTLTRERSEFKARIVQFKRAITDILVQHSHASEKGRVSVNELVLNKEEMEKLLVDNMPQAADNKPLSFLQATLSSLRGEIDSLQNQVNEHSTAVQSSSRAWRELEAQVQDLRLICRSSAATRAQSDQLMQEQLIVSNLQLPQDVTSLLSTSSSSSSPPLLSPSSNVVVMSTTKTTVTNSTNNVVVVE